MPDADLTAVRLTQLSHGGGCGCKIAPARAAADPRPRGIGGLLPKDLLVGFETSDDAAVYRINERQAIVATTDFFTPIVDDPYDFGAIAATNAISDVYAMGGDAALRARARRHADRQAAGRHHPPHPRRRRSRSARRAGIPIAGGHTIDAVEPIYGLVAIGIVDPERLKRNAGARPGDRLVLGKPLGIGIYSAALKQGRLGAEHYAAMIASTTQLNTPGITLGTMESVHALTDVTGFGLLGHLLEVCRASGAAATLDFARIPLHPGVLALARAGMRDRRLRPQLGGLRQRRRRFPPGATDAERALLTDPQTSGGLLVACAPDAVDEVLALFRAEGFAGAAEIGANLPPAPRGSRYDDANAPARSPR